jgi:biotin carboxyl carrier protein
VPQPLPPDARRSERPDAERAADHASIDRLTMELLPALIARLGATGLGELEVREGPWRVRLRRPADGTTASSTPATRERRPGERASGERGGERTADRATRAIPGRTDTRNVATSPAVGIFQPRAEISAGSRVRAGDRLGAVDMLGVAQEVVAPVDGIVGASLVAAGDAVEYGQNLVVIEFGPVTASTNGTGG